MLAVMLAVISVRRTSILSSILAFSLPSIPSILPSSLSILPSSPSILPLSLSSILSILPKISLMPVNITPMMARMIPTTPIRT